MFPNTGQTCVLESNCANHHADSGKVNHFAKVALPQLPLQRCQGLLHRCPLPYTLQHFPAELENVCLPLLLDEGAAVSPLNLPTVKQCFQHPPLDPPVWIWQFQNCTCRLYRPNIPLQCQNLAQLAPRQQPPGTGSVQQPWSHPLGH